MSDHDLLDTLLTAGVLEETAGADVRVTDAFESDLDAARRRIDAGDPATRLSAHVPDGTAVGQVRDLLNEDVELLARYVTLSEYVTAADVDVHLQRMVVLNSVLDGDLPTEGVPEPFLPVAGTHLPFYLQLHRVAVVYVWRTDCPECDGMRGELAESFAGEHGDVGLYAVYGPVCARFLHEEYDVVGGPTTLFIRDGSVDARLQGHFESGIVDDELTKTRSLVEQPN